MSARRSNSGKEKSHNLVGCGGKLNGQSKGETESSVELKEFGEMVGRRWDESPNQ